MGSNTWIRGRNATEKFVKCKLTDYSEISQCFRDKNDDFWREIEKEALEYASEKKSSISELPTESDTSLHIILNFTPIPSPNPSHLFLFQPYILKIT